MNVANYGQSLREIGNANLQDLAEIERARQQKIWELDTLNARAKGEALGSLTGTVAGVIKGGIDSYNQGQTNQDAERAAQGRKEYGTLSDNSQPIDSRIRSTYGQGATDVVNSRVADPETVIPAPTQYGSGGVRAAVENMKTKAAAKNAPDLRGEMADLVKLEPRVSMTKPLLGTSSGGLSGAAATMKNGKEVAPAVAPVSGSGVNPNGVDVKLVSNSPWRDVAAVSKYDSVGGNFDLFVGPRGY